LWTQATSAAIGCPVLLAVAPAVSGKRVQAGRYQTYNIQDTRTRQPVAKAVIKPKTGFARKTEENKNKTEAEREAVLNRQKS
jgi:hypothetical protein